MTYKILLKYGNSSKNLWQFYQTTAVDEETQAETTEIFSTDDLTVLEATVLKLYEEYPVTSVNVIQDVTEEISVNFS